MLDTTSAGERSPANGTGLPRKPNSRSWTAERVQQMCDLRDEGRSYSEIGKILGVSRGAVSGQFFQLRTHADHRGKPVAREMPADFATTAIGMTIRQICATWRVSDRTARSWRRKVGIRVKGMPLPEGFSGLARELSSRELAERFGVSTDTIRRWRDLSGIPQPRRQNFIVRGPGTNIHTAHMDPSVAGRAVRECLQRRGSVYRCDARGMADPKGTFWNRGGHVLTDEEIIARAERLGWDKDEWRRVA